MYLYAIEYSSNTIRSPNLPKYDKKYQQFHLTREAPINTTLRASTKVHGVFNILFDWTFCTDFHVVSHLLLTVFLYFCRNAISPDVWCSIKVWIIILLPCSNKRNQRNVLPLNCFYICNFYKLIMYLFCWIQTKNMDIFRSSSQCN